MEQIIREEKTKAIKIGSSVYVRVPREMLQDSAFPLLILKSIDKKLKDGKSLKIKMMKNKIIVEEE